MSEQTCDNCDQPCVDKSTNSSTPLLICINQAFWTPKKPKIGTIIHASTPGVLKQFEKDTRRSIFRRIWEWIRRRVSAHKITVYDELWVKVRYRGVEDNEHVFEAL